MGRRNRPFYRIVAIDSRTRRDGPEIERLGWFDPLKTDVAVDLKEDRIIHWLQQGAQTSETVNNILSSTGLQFKMHLMREGKSEEEIASALTEWQLRQEEIKAKQSEKKKAKKKAATAQAQTVEVKEDVDTAVEDIDAEKTDDVDESIKDEAPVEEEAVLEEAPEEAVEVKEDVDTAVEDIDAEKTDDVDEKENTDNESKEESS